MNAQLGEEFHKWLQDCPINWTKTKLEDGVGTYIFFKSEI